MITITATGPRALLQDSGRPGFTRLGVGRSGAYDLAALRRANNLVGNALNTVGIEATLGGLRFTVDAPTMMAISGAHCRVPGDEAHWLEPEDTLALGPVGAGARVYVAFAGGVVATSRGDLPMLGSWSTDTLNGLGPAPLVVGMQLTLGDAIGAPAAAGPDADCEGPIRLLTGPRQDWADQPLHRLTDQEWFVDPRSDRVGLRLSGPGITRVVTRELASEPLVRGAVQLPASGQPVIFGPDCPTTGGYPVVAVVHPDDLSRLGQYRPGQRIVFSDSSQR